MEEDKGSNPAGENESSSGTPERDFADEQSGQQAQKDYVNSFSRPNRGLAKLDLKMAMKSKKLMLGGGGALLITLVIASFIALLPLKIEAMMKNIFQHRVGNKIEHMEEKRADKMVVKFLVSSGGGTSDAGIVGDTTLFGALYKTWRLNNFADKFTTKSGISIKPAKGGGITISAPDGVSKDYKNAAEFERFLNGGSERTLKGLDARQFLRTVTRNETHWIQLYKRSNLRKFMRSAYGIHKWSWFSGKTGDAAAAEARDAPIDIAGERLAKDVPDVVNCALDGSNCPADDGERANPEGKHEPVTDKPKVGTTDDSGSVGIDKNSSKYISQATDEAKKLSPAALAERGLTTILTRIVDEQLAKKISSKAIPIVGQILLVDQLARVDHFFTSGQGDKALRTIHKLQYASVFAQWSSIADNFKDPNKHMSGDEVNAYMNKLNGMETSAAFNDVFMNKPGGKTIDAKLGVSDLPKVTPIKNNYNKYILATGAITLATPLRIWYSVSNATQLNVVINAFNKLLGTAFGLLGSLPGVSQALQFLGDHISKLLLQLITPAVDGTEAGASLMNAVDAGGAVTGQDYAKSLGGHTLTDQQTADEHHAIALDNAQAAPSLYQQLFSPSYTPSMVNQLAVIAPHSPSAALGQFSTYSLAVMKNPFHIFTGLLDLLSGKAKADPAIDLYGLQNYGFTEAELNQDLQLPQDYNHDGKIDDQDCHYNTDGTKIDDTAFNDTSKGRICLLDVATAQNMMSIYTKADDGGINDGSTASPEISSGPTNTAGLAWPVPIAGSQVTSCYGPRGSQIHPGDDIAQPIGTPVYAANNGTVAFEGPVNGYGPNFVVIDHGGGTYTSYGHMSAAIVAAGQVVKQGQQIGAVGNEGASSGAHLHFNLFLGGTSYIQGYNGNVEPLTHGLSLPAGTPISGSNCTGIK